MAAVDVEVGEAAPLKAAASAPEEGGGGAGPHQAAQDSAARLAAINQAEKDSQKTMGLRNDPQSTSSTASAPPKAAISKIIAEAPVVASPMETLEVQPLPAQHHTVVPAYPYNVSMSPFIPGSSSNRSDSYFEQHVPDDSNVQTRLPSICVDYLSHDWQEDDIWQSWKAMTKHKSEIANGVRLENASWRTWAKQRGKLKTISPETLNWSAATFRPQTGFAWLIVALLLYTGSKTRTLRGYTAHCIQQSIPYLRGKLRKRKID